MWKSETYETPLRTTELVEFYIGLTFYSKYGYITEIVNRSQSQWNHKRCKNKNSTTSYRGNTNPFL